MHLSDDRYRATALTSVLLLSAASGVLLRTLSRTRGGGRWLDLGIVLALGTLAHWQNVLAGFQIVFTVTVFLFVCVIASLARGNVLTSSRRVLLLVIPLFFLPLAGAQGLVLALPVALWLGVMSLVVGHKVGRPTALAPRLGPARKSTRHEPVLG